MAVTTTDGLEAAVAALRWSAPSEAPDDTPWLLAWLHGKRTGRYVCVPPGEAPERTAARLRLGDNLGEPR